MRQSIRIIRAGSDTALEVEVNKLIEFGDWRLHGSMSHSVVWAIDPHGRPNGRILNELYVQALVREHRE